MATHDVQVFMAVYDDETEAGNALRQFRTMDREGSIDLIDAVVVVRRLDGKVTFEETADPSGKTWAKRGAVAGGLIGLIFPPALIASAAVGAAGGGVWGKLRDKGVKDEELKAMGESLAPGTSAIVALAEDKVVERLLAGLEGYRDVARYALDADAAAIIVAEVEDGSTS